MQDNHKTAIGIRYNQIPIEFVYTWKWMYFRHLENHHWFSLEIHYNYTTVLYQI